MMKSSPIINCTFNDNKHFTYHKVLYYLFKGFPPKEDIFKLRTELLKNSSELYSFGTTLSKGKYSKKPIKQSHPGEVRKEEAR